MLHLDSADKQALALWGIRALAVFFAAVGLAVTLGLALRLFLLLVEL